MHVTADNLSQKIKDSVPTDYTYDEINQLLSEARSGYSASYTYDDNGNRLSKTLNGVTETYTVDSGDKLTEIKIGTTTIKDFDYDAAGRRTSVYEPASNSTTSYVYDYESRITSISRTGITTNSFTYNGLDTRVSKVDSGGTKTYKRAGAYVPAPVLSDGSAEYTPGVSERRSGSTNYFMTERLGTHKGQTSSSAAVTATRTFDAFGMLVSSTGSSSSPFGFAGDWGYQEDADTGVKLLGHRYYDASTGRFLTRDPIRFGRNWYGYVANSPTSAVDPLGLRAISINLGVQVIIGVWSGSLGISLDIGHDGIGVSAQIGSGWAAGLYAGCGVGVSYDENFSFFDPGIANQQGTAWGIATPIASVELTGPAGMTSDSITGGGVLVGPGLYGGAYAEQRRRGTIPIATW